MLQLRLCLGLQNIRSRCLATSCTVWKKNKGLVLKDLLSNMPKEETHLVDLKEKRLVKRSKRTLKPPARVSWQVLGSGARGGPKSLLLNTDNRRYLFNCGEGTQRLTTQLALSRTLAQLEHVFITSKSWGNLGGLPGLCLSVRAAGAPDVTIHGPPGCMELYEATKGFIMLFNFDVLRHRLEDGEHSDGAVTIRSVQLQRDTPTTAPEVSSTWEGLTDTEREAGTIQYDDSVVAYICSLQPKPGRLNVEACYDKGIKPGPLLGQLKDGKDVVLEDGSVVKAKDVVAESAPASSYLVLELPDIHYLHSFKDSKDLSSVEHLQTVFHFSPIHVVKTPTYQDWMSSLGTSVTHVMLNEDSMGLGLPDVSIYQHKLRTIRGDMFPRLQGNGDHCKGPRELANTIVTSAIGSSIASAISNSAAECPKTQARSGLKVTVRPHTSNPIDLFSALPFHPEDATKELLEGCSKLTDEHEREVYKEGMQQDLAYARNFIPNLQSPQSLAEKLEAVDHEGDDNKRIKLDVDDEDLINKSSDQFPVITFLGTGSSVPSKYRNVSAILVETEKDSWILLDCGEGSLSQLVRLYGWDRAMQILRGLKAVYISHLHADHHLGMINFILHRQRAFQEADLPVSSLYLIATKKMSEFLTYYHAKLQPILCHAELIQCEHLIHYDDLKIPGKKVQLLYNDRMSTLLNDLKLNQISTCKAIHCPHAFSITLTSRAGFKLAYSGDTRPNPSFRDLALQDDHPPDLLIHEATMEHFMLYDAKIKKHSTFTEAIEEGEGMKAKYTLLTHFSQRYAKMPPLEEIEGKANVGIAFDNMVITPELLPYIPSVYPAISRWMWDHCLEMSDKADHYKNKFSEDVQVDMGPDLGDMDMITTPLQMKQKLAEKLEQRYKEKEETFKRIVRKKKIMAERGEKISKPERKKTENKTSSSN